MPYENIEQVLNDFRKLAKKKPNHATWQRFFQDLHVFLQSFNLTQKEGTDVLLPKLEVALKPYVHPQDFANIKQLDEKITNKKIHLADSSGGEENFSYATFSIALLSVEAELYLQCYQQFERAHSHLAAKKQELENSALAKSPGINSKIKALREMQGELDKLKAEMAGNIASKNYNLLPIIQQIQTIQLNTLNKISDPLNTFKKLINEILAYLLSPMINKNYKIFSVDNTEEVINALPFASPKAKL